MSVQASTIFQKLNAMTKTQNFSQNISNDRAEILAKHMETVNESHAC
jgi:hypothetical protein